MTSLDKDIFYYIVISICINLFKKNEAILEGANT